mgnify:CR=1 FL=1
MKSFLIIGMGNFGHYLCQELAKYDCEIMIIDNVEERVDDMLPYVTSAKIGDCTNMEVLESLGVSNFDACFICVGDNFQNSLEITSLVKELGGKLVISRAVRDLHAKFLLRNGADRVMRELPNPTVIHLFLTILNLIRKIQFMKSHRLRNV